MSELFAPLGITALDRHSQTELFPCRPGIDWLPDETVFSLASRYHLLSGNIRPQRTAIQLFGGSHSGFPHDLPSGIDHFAHAHEGHLGTPESIIQSHTVLPFFLPFRDLADTQDALASMRGSCIGGLKSRLGMPASRFGAVCPLKACHLCIETDRHAYGVAYWHATHQLPAVWRCPTHDTALLFSARMASGAARFHWLLPRIDDLELGCHWPSTTEAKEGEKTLASLMHCILVIAKLPAQYVFHADRLLATYHDALQAQDLMTSVGRLRIAAIGNAYFDAMKPMRVVPELEGVAPNPKVAASQASRLLREQRAVGHTLWHITLIVWLFGTWETFLCAYEGIEISHRKLAGVCSETSSSVETSQRVNPQQGQLILLLQTSDISISHAAQVVGVDVATAQAWAAQANIANPTRPKRIKAELRMRLVNYLKSGMEKAAVGLLVGVSLPSVNRVLRMEIGLHGQWRRAREERTQRVARDHWTSALKSASGLGVTGARMLDPKSYAWLYRNDRTWLKAINEMAESAARSNNSHVDWDARDQELAHRVELAWQELSGTDPSAHVTIAQICSVVRELKPKLRRLESLPLTTRVLRRAINRSPRQSSAPDRLRTG